MLLSDVCVSYGKIFVFVIFFLVLMSIEFSFKFVFLIIDEVWYVFVVMKCGVDELLIEEEFV